MNLMYAYSHLKDDYLRLYLDDALICNLRALEVKETSRPNELQLEIYQEDVENLIFSLEDTKQPINIVLGINQSSSDDTFYVMLPNTTLKESSI